MNWQSWVSKQGREYTNNPQCEERAVALYTTSKRSQGMRTYSPTIGRTLLLLIFEGRASCLATTSAESGLLRLQPRALPSCRRASCRRDLGLAQVPGLRDCTGMGWTALKIFCKFYIYDEKYHGFSPVPRLGFRGVSAHPSYCRSRRSLVASWYRQVAVASDMHLWSSFYILSLLAVRFSDAYQQLAPGNPHGVRYATPKQPQPSVCYSYYTTFLVPFTPKSPQETQIVDRCVVSHQ